MLTPRQDLPARRVSTTLKLKTKLGTLFICVGYFAGSDQPGEVFISGSKVGSDMRSLLDALAIMISMALQHGADLRDLTERLTLTPDDDIAHAIGNGLRSLNNDGDKNYMEGAGWPSEAKNSGQPKKRH